MLWSDPAAGMDDADDDCPDADLPSCTGCRKRKLKCSRQKPACSNCERLQVSCLYDGRRNKPGLRSGVVDSLSQRLERVERAVFGEERQAQAEHNYHAGSDDGVHPRQQRRAPAVPIDSLASLAGACSSLVAGLQALSRAHQDTADHDYTNTQRSNRLVSVSALEEPSPPVHARKRARTQYSASDVGPESESYDNSSYFEDLFSAPGLARLPSHVLEEMMEDMLDLYFTRIQPWVPMLHEQKMRSDLNSSTHRATLMVILRAMTIASLRFIEVGGHRLESRHVEAVTQKLKHEVLLESMTGMQIQNVQALIILAFVEIGDGNMTAAWPLIGSLTRTVEHLELSTEVEDRPSRPALVFGCQASLPRPIDWLEEEERRRVFWNVFILDRFSSLTQGWNTSLTAADVSRRLPVDGGKWYMNEPALTPYFGIWDRSTAKIGKSIAFLPTHYPNPNHAPMTSDSTKHTSPVNQAHNGLNMDNMSNVGAVGYYIESIESLSQITTYFLQTKVNFGNPKAVSEWLTRFKELDLRLVHWKMYLPQQWKDSGVSREIMPGVMDPNMTIANATHNISMVLLHQRIAYPTADLRGIRLPSEFSADTCSNAALETIHIIQKYISGLSADKPVSPQMGLCAYVSARVLLVHHQYYKTPFPDEFQLTLQSLEQMHRHWRGICAGSPQEQGHGQEVSSFFVQLAQQLAKLKWNVFNLPDYRVTMTGVAEENNPTPTDTRDSVPSAATGQTDTTNPHRPRERPSLLARFRPPGTHSTFPASPQGQQHGPSPQEYQRQSRAGDKSAESPRWPAQVAALVTGGSVSNPTTTSDVAYRADMNHFGGAGYGWAATERQEDSHQQQQQKPHDMDQLSAISQILMDDTFLGMDRIISFDDMMHSDNMGGPL